MVLLVTAALLAGCNGGTVDRHALTNDAAAVSSINCEGWLLARAVARGRTTHNYTSGQAEALRVQAANLADALGTRPTTPALERRVRVAGQRAGVLASRLQQLRDRVSGRSAATQLAQEFKRAGNCS